MTTITHATMTVSVNLSDEQIDARVAEVNEYERFSAITIVRRSEDAFFAVVEAKYLMITSSSGSIYFGHVEDWDDNSGEIYINLD